MTNMVFRERILINSMFFMVPNIVFAPNIRKMQNTDTGRKTQTQLITGFELGKKIGASDWLKMMGATNFRQNEPVC